MAMRTLRAICVLAAMLSLGSCQVLAVVFGSVFPSTTTLIKAQADLSGLIPSDSGGSFHVRVVESQGYGYVVVVGNPQSGSEAFFYDLDLNQKKTFTGLAGNGIMVDANGNIVVGSSLLNPATLASTEISVTLGSSNTGGVDGFVESANSQIANFNISSATLNYSIYPFPWAAGSQPSPLPTLSASLSNLQIYAILDDEASGNVTFVVGPQANNNTATCYFFSTVKSNFAVKTNVLDSSPLYRDNLYTNSFGYAQGSIFAYDSGSSSFVRIDPSTGTTLNSFYDGSVSTNSCFAYRISGGSFYGFDTNTRVLKKYGQWW